MRSRGRMTRKLSRLKVDVGGNKIEDTIYRKWQGLPWLARTESAAGDDKGRNGANFRRVDSRRAERTLSARFHKPAV